MTATLAVCAFLDFELHFGFVLLHMYPHLVLILGIISSTGWTSLESSDASEIRNTNIVAANS